MNEHVDADAQVVAAVFPTLSWTYEDGDEIAVAPDHPRKSVVLEAIRWQELSAQASSAEIEAHPFPWRRSIKWGGEERIIEPKSGVAPRDPNRILEIHGLMGAIGEQLGLAYSAEQDVQRLSQLADHRDEIDSRTLTRAHAELAGHFLLGAAHSLANLVLRVLLLNNKAAVSLLADYSVEAFPPGSDDRKVWPTFSPDMARRLRRAGRESDNSGMARLAEIVSQLGRSRAYRELDGRRGMDYHRRRPQSVPHTAPREGTVKTENGTTSMAQIGPRLEPDANALEVSRVVADALEQVSATMRDLRAAIPDAIRGEGISYIYDFLPDPEGWSD